MSRYLQLYVEKWIMNILVIQSINRLSNSESEIFLRKPYIFNEKLIFLNTFANLTNVATVLLEGVCCDYYLIITLEFFFKNLI